ncbi:MAG: AMP-binding protein [Planctomycetota bacterium]|nr:AMP-binding protein [Planctomycetota bacterium]
MNRLLVALAEQCATAPDRVRVTDPDGREWTNRALLNSVDAVSRAIELRCAAGSFVAVSVPSGGHFWIASLAVMLAGCDAVLMANAAPGAMMERVQRELAPSIIIDSALLAELIHNSAASAADSKCTQPHGGIVLLSSGTTGVSRFVHRSPEAVDCVAAGLVDAQLYQPNDIVGSFLPMHHAYGCEHAFLAPLLCGASVRQQASFTIEGAHEFISQGVTVLPLVPAAAAALASSVIPPHTLRCAVVAGSPLRKQVRTHFERVFGIPLVDLYGASEVGTIWLDRGTGGHPIAGVDVRLVDPLCRESMIDVPTGAGGELAVRSNAAFDRIVGHAGDQEPMQSGYFRTGDLGVRSADGLFHITGREKLVFDVAGLKVNPYDIEAAIEEHPDVAVALVEPVVLADGLTRVAASIELTSPDIQLDAATLRAFIAERVPAHAVPRTISFVKKFKRTASGKVLRMATVIPPVVARPSQLRNRSDRERWTQALFNNSAMGYDRANGALLGGLGHSYRRRILQASGLREGMSVLDVGSGTGMCALLEQEIVGKSGRVVALDPSSGMLEVARTRGVRETVLGAAEHLPFASASFDCVSMAYMLRHVEDMRVVFAEARRVLRTGGRIVVLEVTAARGTIAAPIFRFAMRHVAPAVGVLASGRPSTFPMMRYWAETVDDAVRPAVIVSALETAGFVGVRHATELSVMSYYRGVVPE